MCDKRDRAITCSYVMMFSGLAKTSVEGKGKFGVKLFQRKLLSRLSHISSLLSAKHLKSSAIF